MFVRASSAGREAFRLFLSERFCSQLSAAKQVNTEIISKLEVTGLREL